MKIRRASKTLLQGSSGKGCEKTIGWRPEGIFLYSLILVIFRTIIKRYIYPWYLFIMWPGRILMEYLCGRGREYVVESNKLAARQEERSVGLTIQHKYLTYLT